MSAARLGYRSWQLGLGLLPVPLFFHQEDQPRHVLLNGVEGNFCLDEEVALDMEQRASVAWSSNVGHHVYVDSNVVEVTRWDKPLAAQKYTTSSIQAQLEAFHKHLQNDSPTSQASVVSHALGVYRAIRSGLRDGDSGSNALAAFLYLLACAAAGADLGEGPPNSWALPTGARESFLLLKQGDQGFFLDRLLGRVGASLLRPDFRLMLRHASGALFQEAHAQVILPEEDWLPGLGPLDAVVRANSISVAEGAFFTPPSIARTLAEEALRELDLSAVSTLEVFDPACGSGELLKEVLRLLEVAGYSGAITLRGWDKSRAAVDIARFSLSWEAQSWNGRVRVEIQEIDSVLAQAWPRQVNVLVMNPPFRSWQHMTHDEQEAVNLQMGDLQANKPNLASVFIRRAIHSLAQGGVVATVAPRSFFDSRSAEPLREEIAGVLQSRVVVNLANPAIYSYATVQSGLFVATKGAAQAATTLVWTDPQSSSVGEALRGLRRFQLGAEAAINEQSYSVYRDHHFSGRQASWLPRPYTGWVLGKLLEEREGLVAAGSLYHIRQGVRMGSDAFLVPRSFVETLGEDERRYFRPAVTNSTLEDGKLSPSTFVFYPYTVGLPVIRTDDDLRQAVPTYFEEYLRPVEAQLRARKSLDRANQPWWGLIWPREWQYEIAPKLVSKYFGHAGSFAWDERGSYVVVVGHGWIPKPSTKYWQYVSTEEHALASLAVLNSSLGEQLLSRSSVQVGGGQWDLSSKHIASIPVLAPTKTNAPMIKQLAALWRSQVRGEGVQTKINELAASAYGLPVNAFRH